MKTAAPAAPDVARPLLSNGCFDDVDLDVPAEALLESLAADCGHGMMPVAGTARRVEPAATGRAELAIDVADVSKCLRVLAVAVSRSDRLELELSLPTGRVLSTSALGQRFALLGEQGPVCPDTTGAHRLRVTGATGPTLLSILHGG